MNYSWKNGTKYYKIIIQQNLFGTNDIICCWGRSGTNKGGMKIISNLSDNAITLQTEKILKRRKYRGYSLTSSFIN